MSLIRVSSVFIRGYSLFLVSGFSLLVFPSAIGTLRAARHKHRRLPTYPEKRPLPRKPTLEFLPAATAVRDRPRPPRDTETAIPRRTPGTRSRSGRTLHRTVAGRRRSGPCPIHRAS